jgi:prepilin peptidase CpaA
VTEIVINIVLLIFLLGAVVTDVRARIIPNVLVAAGALSGVLLSGLLPQGIGFLGSLAGIGIGLGCFLPLYVLRAMGAGDVKLMAMAGAFLGPLATLEAILWVFLAGGVLALVFAMRQGVVRKMLGNVSTLFYSAAASVQTRNLPDFSETPSTGKLPYAVAIASGVAIFLLARAGGFNLL